MSLHFRIRDLFISHPITMGFLLCAMVVEGWRLTILYLISSNTLIPALIFAVLIQSTIFFLAILGYVKSSVMFGVISAALSFISFIPFLDVKYTDSTTIKLIDHVKLPEFQSFPTDIAQYAFNLRYYKDLDNANKQNAQIDKDNAETKKNNPTLKKEAGYDYYAAIIVVLIASIFPSTVVVVVSHQVSNIKNIGNVSNVEHNVNIKGVGNVTFRNPTYKDLQETITQEPKQLEPSQTFSRNGQLINDHFSGKFKNITELAAEYGISSQRASAIIKKYKGAF